MTSNSKNVAYANRRSTNDYAIIRSEPDPSGHQVQLRSGAWITLRPAVPADAVQLVEMHLRLSPASRYHRYLRPHSPGLGEMQEICGLAPETGEAFVAESSQKAIIGLIYYIRDNPPADHQAEFGVTIEDGFQGGGLGRAMLDHMCAKASAHGVQRMDANVLTQNRKMLHLLDTCGKPLHKSLSAGFITVTLDIRQDDDEAQRMCFLADAAARPLPAAQMALCA